MTVSCVGVIAPQGVLYEGNLSWSTWQLHRSAWLYGFQTPTKRWILDISGITKILALSISPPLLLL